MKTCYNCKNEVPENSIYCMYCAAPLKGKDLIKQTKNKLDIVKLMKGIETDNEAVEYLLNTWYENADNDKREKYDKMKLEDKRQDLSNQAK